MGKKAAKAARKRNEREKAEREASARVRDAALAKARSKLVLPQPGDLLRYQRRAR